MNLEFIRKYIERNPYTGGVTVDTVALEKDPAFKKLLGSVWEDGYSCGADDIIEDCTVEQAHCNPYSS